MGIPEEELAWPETSGRVTRLPRLHLEVDERSTVTLFGGVALAAAWRVPLASRVLERVRETRSQTRLDPTQRTENVRRAFRARPVGRVGVGGRGSPSPTVILVDDVLTTGATLVAASTALAHAGWTSVRAVTFARALPFAERVAMAGQSGG